jgi:predicted phosphodiesterase
MRFYVLSDLHLEFEPFTPPPVDADVVILAGDIHVGRPALEWALATFPNRPVIYVLGNHEFYGQTLPGLTEEFHELAAGTNIHVLENESAHLGGVTILGATLWTDVALNGDPVVAQVNAQIGMTDYHRIQTSPQYGQLKPSDTRRLHLQTLRWLECQALESKNRKLVIVTHHAPSRKSIAPRFEHDPLNPAFVSHLDPFIVETRAQLWIHGHLHHASDYRVGETRVLANPRGYPDELDHGFDPGLVVEV